MIDKNAVWLVTGCSTGLGRAIAQQALRSGYRAVVTARDASTVADLVDPHPQTAFAVSLDVTDAARVPAAIASAENRFGGVDVLVNNAGYGYLGAIEEGEDEDVRALFETNVFGLWQKVKAALPGMRARGRGHVVNISSVGGLTTFPGKQNGDPILGARAIIAALEAPPPPLHLVIGSDALDLARQKLVELARDFDAWETVTRSTDFAPG